MTFESSREVKHQLEMSIKEQFFQQKFLQEAKGSQKKKKKENKIRSIKIFSS